VKSRNSSQCNETLLKNVKVCDNTITWLAAITRRLVGTMNTQYSYSTANKGIGLHGNVGVLELWPSSASNSEGVCQHSEHIRDCFHCTGGRTITLSTHRHHHHHHHHHHATVNHRPVMQLCTMPRLFVMRGSLLLLAVSEVTSSLSKAHVTRGGCHVKNQCSTCNKVVMRFERVPKSTASVRMTPWTQRVKTKTRLSTNNSRLCVFSRLE